MKRGQSLLLAHERRLPSLRNTTSHCKRVFLLSFDLANARVGTTLCYSSLKVTKLDGFMRQNETPSPTVHSAAFQRVRMGKSLSISLIIKTELQSVALQRTEGFLKLYINQTQLNAGVESLNLSAYFFSFLR